MAGSLTGIVVHPYGLRSTELRWLNSAVPKTGAEILSTLADKITHIITRDGTEPDEILSQIVETRPTVQVVQLGEFRQLVASGTKPDTPAKAAPKAKASSSSATTNSRKRKADALELVYDGSSDDEATKATTAANAPKRQAPSSEVYDSSKRRKISEETSVAVTPAAAPQAPSPATLVAKPPITTPARPQSKFNLSSLKWSQNNTLYYFSAPDLPGSELVAAFDMDSTLIEPSSGRKFPTGRADWRWWHASVPEKLKELYAQGYKIVIFTNQGGIAKKNQKPSDLTGKVEDLMAKLGIPLQVFMASDKDTWRKPNTTMWDLFVQKHNQGVSVDVVKSFYCGDAGGRIVGWKAGAKKDFSCSDRKFAHNCGLHFKLPEELFLGQVDVAAAKFNWDCIDPAKALADTEAKSAIALAAIKKAIGSASKPEMILMVGCPASGKSSFSKKHLVPLGYVRINRDELKTPEKCLAAAKEALNAKKSVVIDNTNPSVDARSRFISLAKQCGVPVRCFVMTTPRNLAEHLNLVRERVTNGVDKRIPDIAYNTYFKNYVAPSTSEGVTSIVSIDWAPEFPDESHRKLFLQYTE